MQKELLVPIVRKQWGTIYGQVIDNAGRLGRFKVQSEVYETDDIEYALYSDAESKLKHLEYLFNK